MLVRRLCSLSGALYRLSGLRAWLSVLTRIDPLTYIVGPMRHAVFNHLTIAAASEQHLSPGITWAGWVVPLGLSLRIVTIIGLGITAAALPEFPYTDEYGKPPTGRSQAARGVTAHLQSPRTPTTTR